MVDEAALGLAVLLGLLGVMLAEWAGVLPESIRYLLSGDDEPREDP